MLFEHEGRRVAAIPFTNRWGDQTANYAWQVLSDMFLHLSRTRTSALHYPHLTHMYTDDFFGFGSLAWAHDELDQFTADLHTRFGPDAIASHKNLFGPQITILGWLFDCDAATLSLTERSFLKLVCLFFVEVPSHLDTSTTLPLRTLQRLSSYALRYSDAIRSILFASRGFSQNLQHLPSHSNPTTPVKLTVRSIHDIQTWRALLALCVTDTSFMTIPIAWPPLLTRLPSERPPQLIKLSTESKRQFSQRISLQQLPYAHAYDQRMANSAHLVAYSDACTPDVESPGIGFIIPPNPHISQSWFSSPYTLPLFYSTLGDLTEARINVYELIGILTLVYTVGIQRERTHGHSHTYFHLHVWTDSASSLWWCRKHRFDSPFHGFLLTLFSFLQVRFNMIVTLGHIKGDLNFLSDAASRRHLSPTTHHNASTNLPSALNPTFDHILTQAGYTLDNHLNFPVHFMTNLAHHACDTSLSTSAIRAAILMLQEPLVS
jgi:hypothetical protein